MNIIDSIHNRLSAIEQQLKKLDNSFTPNESDVWEKGLKMPAEVLNMKEIFLLMNLEVLPKNKFMGECYFNKPKLQEFMKNNQNRVNNMRQGYMM